MGSAVKLRNAFSAAELRRLAKAVRDISQSRRLLSLAAVLDGMSREQAARIGGMDRQTLRDWVHRFNEQGPEGLKDIRNGGVRERLSIEQKAELAQIVETGPDPGWTAWCAGAGSISSASSRNASASSITNAMSASF